MLVPETALGLACVVLGGAVQGAYVLPLKYTRRWPRENTWLIYSSVAMLLLPWVFAVSATSGLWAAYRQSSWHSLLLVGACGLAWGVGNVLYGLGAVALGIALAAALILGITAALGSLIPLLLQHPQDLLTRAGALTVLGVVAMLTGVATCALAGRERNRSAPPSGRFIRGVLICVASGILSAFLNFGFIFGAEIASRAREQRNTPAASLYPVLALLLSGGFLASFAHTIHQLNQNRTWKRFREVGTGVHWVLAGLMGVLLFGGYILYGNGVAMLGGLGPSVGWSVFLSVFIITANVAGILTGEWGDASAGAVRTMWCGNSILLLAVILLGLANRA